MSEVKIDPEETALLLIDMQNDLLHEEGVLPNWMFGKNEILF